MNNLVELIVDNIICCAFSSSCHHYLYEQKYENVLYTTVEERYSVLQGEGGGGLNSTLQLHVSLLINFITLIKGHFIDRCKKMVKMILSFS